MALCGLLTPGLCKASLSESFSWACGSYGSGLSAPSGGTVCLQAVTVGGRGSFSWFKFYSSDFYAKHTRLVFPSVL